MATTRVTTFASLVEGYQHTDPKLYQILSGFIKAIGEIQAELHPVVRQVAAVEESLTAIPLAPTEIHFEILNQRILRIFWSGGENAATYEIRKGTDWNTATFVTATNQTEVRLDPILVGTHRYLVKARNGVGFYSPDTIELDVTIPPIGVSSITTQVIDNFVLIRYSEPDSVWEINYYNLYRNGALIGAVDSEFFVWFESVAGLFTYAVEAVDIAGNVGPLTEITTSVSQPPDFELEDQRFSLLAGTKVNAQVVGAPILGWDYTQSQGWVTEDYAWFASNTGKILVCVNTTEQYDDHFTTRTWDSPADQIAAGYPIYIQPTSLTGQYQETIDYGGVFNNIILSLSWTLLQLTSAGTVSVASLIEFSLDGVNWDPPENGPSAFTPSFRYARITFNFSADNDKALALFSNLQLLLNVKREVDSGEVNANASDIDGTEVFFNKSFKDVDSITVTPTKQVEPLEAIYDFVDVPNPVSFKVYVFDSTGNRTSAKVSWKARGIV